MLRHQPSSWRHSRWAAPHPAPMPQRTVGPTTMTYQVCLVENESVGIRNLLYCLAHILSLWLVQMSHHVLGIHLG